MSNMGHFGISYRTLWIRVIVEIPWRCLQFSRPEMPRQISRRPGGDRHGRFHGIKKWDG